MPPRLSASEKTRFELEIIPHLDVLYRMARAVCCQTDFADDVAQEAFLKALNGFSGFKPGSNGRGWLARIVHNTCRDHWRAHARRGEESWDDDLATEAQEMASDRERDWQPRVIRDAFDDEIETALRALPARWRACVLLVDVEGWSYEEAAASLEISSGSLRSALHRARKVLYRALSPSSASTREQEGGSTA